MGGIIFWIVIAIIIVGGLLYWYRNGFQFPSGGVSLSVIFPQHLNDRIANRITEANDRVTQAKAALETSQTVLANAENEADAANPRIPALDAKVQRTRQDIDRAQDIVKFEESQLDQLLHPDRSRGLLDRINWATVLQYVIFASLALFVLWHLMSGITSSPPPGTTPRSMITLLIAVVTVGIALILVLATIVSDSEDREKRFSQGKEVLTALLGVLGTIVGFYFGTSQDQVKGFDFDPVVIRMEANKPITLSTSVHGGKAPYFFETTFTPASIPPVKDKSLDGRITAPIDVKDAKPDTDISVLINVTDSEGKTGHIEYKQVIRLKPVSDK